MSLQPIRIAEVNSTGTLTAAVAFTNGGGIAANSATANTPNNCVGTAPAVSNRLGLCGVDRIAQQ